jgi:hypothetical protein
MPAALSLVISSKTNFVLRESGDPHHSPQKKKRHMVWHFFF